MTDPCRHLRPTPPRRTAPVAAALAGALAALAACRAAPPDAGHHPAGSEGGQIPITTVSAEARQLYLKGRGLAENLRAAEARRYFENAVARDPGFAMAQFGLAQASSSPQEFFARLDRAVALAEGVSDGERKTILALAAGVRSAPAEQERLLREVAEAYPEDPRAQFQLGQLYLGRQEWELALGPYQRAIEIAPAFPPPYNGLGYAYRFLGRYDDAESSFKKYVALVPGEPNPHDSYAELLMKIGRFEESIANYRKALSIDDGFVPSYLGIGFDQVFLGRPDEARATFDRLYQIARDDGERREALFGTVACWVFEGDHDRALAAARRRAALAEASGDLTAQANDRALLGDLLLDAGRPREALAEYDRAVDLIGRAGVSEEIKEQFRRNYHYKRARVALAEGDLAAAAAEAAAYRAAVDLTGVPFEERRTHELAGRLAFARGDAAAAVAEFDHADREDPQVVYTQALAARAAGDLPRARELAAQAADFNGLGIAYAYVRTKAKALVAELG